LTLSRGIAAIVLTYYLAGETKAANAETA